jgi:predicted DNA-binding transcriptional regulator YafY
MTKELSETRESFPATLRLEPQAAKWILTWHSAKQVGSADSNGWLTINLEFENEDDARFVVLGLGTRVEVVQPKSLISYLRKQTAELHAKLLNASA